MPHSPPTPTAGYAVRMALNIREVVEAQVAEKIEKGEALADAGRSVRGGNTPADPQGITMITISNSTNVAVGSPGTTQTYALTQQRERSVAVADALERASGASPAAAEAHRIASEIKAESGLEKPDSSRLQQLVMSAITAGSAALGQAAATDLIHLVSQALQTF